MTNKKKFRLASYDMISPGWEAVYTGEKRSIVTDSTDNEANVIKKWSVWECKDDETRWDNEIKCINKLQMDIGNLDKETRQIRAHIASLTLCDCGLPVAVDELLDAIGRGRLNEPSFRNGCWYGGMWWKMKSTQPCHLESMRTVHEVVTGYLAGKPRERFVQKYPHAEGFIRRTYEWLGPMMELTKIQKLLIERMLLPFDFFTKASHADPRPTWPEDAEAACEAAMKDCYEEGGRGAQIDAQIAAIAGLPKISMKYPEQARTVQIDNPEKMDLYILCCALAHGLHTLSDCHHSTFRWIENWLYSIGTGKWGIPTREIGTERERVGRLLFGYLLGLDKWLLDIPMQFLLLDLGHVDLGFDPKNEIVKVYAYLGEDKMPVKEWLVACLCHSLMYSTGGLVWRDKHKDLADRARQLEISVREWMDSVLRSDPGSR